MGRCAVTLCPSSGKEPIICFIYINIVFMPWRQRDFVSFGEPYLVLQNGSPDDQDWHIGTGSVFEHDGLFTFHYTGFCEGNNGVEGKKCTGGFTGDKQRSGALGKG